jgi:hypothetical protein
MVNFFGQVINDTPNRRESEGMGGRRAKRGAEHRIIMNLYKFVYSNL